MNQNLICCWRYFNRNTWREHCVTQNKSYQSKIAEAGLLGSLHISNFSVHECFWVNVFLFLQVSKEAEVKKCSPQVQSAAVVQ